MDACHTRESSGCGGSAHPIIQLAHAQNSGSAFRRNSTDARGASGITVAVAHYAITGGTESNDLRMALDGNNLVCADLVQVDRGYLFGNCHEALLYVAIAYSLE